MTDDQFEKAKKLRSDISHEENNIRILENMDMNPECFVSPRCAKKHKSKQVLLIWLG